MAEKKPEAPAEGDAAAPKSKKKLMIFIIIGVVVLVLIIGGIGAFLYFKKKAADAEDPDAEPATEQTEKTKTKKKDKDPHAAPAFYKFDKPFTVKLQSEGSDNYLQVDVQMRLLDASLVDQIKAFDPELKHKVTLLLLGKTASDLSSSQGVQTLSNQLRDVINHTVDHSAGKKKKKGDNADHGAVASDDADPDAPVQAVLFTTFIIQ